MSSFFVQGQYDCKNYFNELRRLYQNNDEKYLFDFTNKSECKKFFKLNGKIKEVVEDNIRDLVNDLRINPNHHQFYQEIKDNLKSQDLTSRTYKTSCAIKKNEIEELTNSIETTIDLIEKIASFLHHPEKKKGATEFSLSGLNHEQLASLLRQYKYLKLPGNIDDIRKISLPYIKASLIAAIINRDRLPIMLVGLTKEELMQVAPHLTYLCYKDSLDEFWSKDEIDAFLKACINLKTLMIKSNLITHLPALESCVFLNCSGCKNLEELPPHLLNKEIHCKGCDKLALHPLLPLSSDLNRSSDVLLCEEPLFPIPEELRAVKVKPFKTEQIKVVYY